MPVEIQSNDIDLSVCPLCQQNNLCGNLPVADGSKVSASESGCWCMRESISEGAKDAVRAQVPDSLQGKVCICQVCAQSYRAVSV